MAILKKIHPLRVGYFCAIVMIIPALVFAGLSFFVHSQTSSTGSQAQFGSPIITPMLIIVIGFLIGFLCAVLYNWYAKVFTGIEVEFENNR